jgi:hypothetical protein
LLGREISLSLPPNRVLGDLSSSGLVWHLPFLTFLSRYRQTNNNNNNNNTFFFFFFPTITCIFHETDFISPSRFLSTARRDCFGSSFCTDLQPVYCAAGLVPGWLAGSQRSRLKIVQNSGDLVVVLSSSSYSKGECHHHCTFPPILLKSFACASKNQGDDYVTRDH